MKKQRKKSNLTASAGNLLKPDKGKGWIIVVAPTRQGKKAVHYCVPIPSKRLAKIDRG